jgi:ABC-2 type transport system permease protein
MMKKISFKEILNKRSLRFGSYSFILTAIVIAAAILLNSIVSGTKLRDKLKIDLTSNKLYSVGETTGEVLKELDTEVEIIGLFDEKAMESTQYGQVIEFIKQYENKSSMIKIKYVDPAKNPAYIQNELDPTGVLGVSNYDFVVRSGKRAKVLSSSDIFEYTFDSQTYSGYYLTGLNAEYAFTGAIRYVTSENIPVIYFAEGHGEGDPDNDFSELKSDLELNGYEIKKINLAAVETVPEDASLIIFANPLQDLSIAETV